MTIVGIPKETKRDEYRVALLPVGVEDLVRAGHTVIVQRTAGAGSGLPDEAYQACGARLVDTAAEVFAEADLVGEQSAFGEGRMEREKRGVDLMGV